jgi:hypothetical protein
MNMLHHIARSSQRSPLARAGLPAYILLELVIALSIFAIAVVGLAKSLNTTLEVGNIMNKDNAVRLGLRSFIEETKRKAAPDMALSITDDKLGVTYTSTVEPLSVVTPRNGQAVQDCFRVTFTASYQAGAEVREESVELWFYQNQAEQEKRRNR